MMKRVGTIRVLLAALVLLGSGETSAAGKTLKVVATLSTFADLTKTIGGAHVEVSFIASPKFNPHFIEPKPSDILKVKRADLLVHAGLDLELWRGPLLDAAGNTTLFPGGPGELDLSQRIALLEVPGRAVSRAEGDIHIYGNPHYWTDPENAVQMAKTITEKLCALDPEHEADYRDHLDAFLTRLDEQTRSWRARLAPYRGEEVIGYHNEWPYLMRFAGLSMSQFLEPKPGIPPTPKHLAFLEQYVVEKRIRVIVQSTYFPAQAARSIAARTGARVIDLCQNVQEVAACADYVAMLDHNVSQLVGALSHD